MKTLSIRQPWASVLALGLKDVENRTWKTAYRGKVLLHASSAKVPKNYLSNDKLPIEYINMIDNLLFQTDIDEDMLTGHNGAIVGYADLVDVVEDSESLWAWPGDVHWVFENARFFKEPIKDVKGKLNLWDYEDITEDNLPEAIDFSVPAIEVNGTEVTVQLCHEIFNSLYSKEDEANQFFIYAIPWHHDHLFDLDEEGNGPMKKFETIRIVLPDGESHRFKLEANFYDTLEDEEGNEVIFQGLFSAEAPKGMLNFVLGEELK